MADHLSRYAADPEYIKPEYHAVDGTTPELEDDLMSKFVSFNAEKKRYTLLEPRVEVALRDIWATISTMPQAEAQTPPPDPTAPRHDKNRTTDSQPEETTTSRLLGAFAMESEADSRMFAEEQKEAEVELCH